jgi:hypothetical protein
MGLRGGSQADGKRGKKLQVATLNRELQVLRRMFTLAEEWRKVERALPKVAMLPGKGHRDRVLSDTDEALYFRAASSKAMDKHADPALLGDVAAILFSGVIGFPNHRDGYASVLSSGRRLSRGSRAL